jgi:ABC-2 type transport system ATP-binding protein
MSGADFTKVHERASHWLERLELTQWRHTRVSKFSKGMNERLAFAQALVHEPEFIFLDEPTDGLDPLGRREVRKICRELADMGKTVFINSHILAEIEMICDRAALMKSGGIIEQGTIAELTSASGEYEIVLPADQVTADWLREKHLRFATLNSSIHVYVNGRGSANSLIDTLRQRRVEIESMSARKRTLESVFIERVAGE